jgi:hypothetical protein
MCQDKFERRQIKMGSGVPTIPASTDHRNGDWIATDIYDGELYMDTNTGLTYTRNGASIIPAGSGAENFANADLTLTAIRTHDLNSFGVLFENGSVGIDSTGVTVDSFSVITDNSNLSYSAIVVENTNSGNAFVVNDGLIKFLNMPVYANEAGAVGGGLATGTLYKTATGELRIKL